MANGDAFGFGTNLLGVTARPAPPDSRALTATDTFAANCSNAQSADGTEYSAEWANEIVANLRALLRGNKTLLDGVTPIAVEDHSDGMLLAAVQQMIQRRRGNFAVDGGAANALVASVTPAPAEMIDGFEVTVKVAYAPTGPTSLALNGETPRNVLRKGGAALTGGEWAAGDIVTFRRVGVAWRLTGLVLADLALAIAGLPVSGLVPSGIAGSLTTAAMAISAGACGDSTGATSAKLPAAVAWSVTNGNAANGFQGGAALPANSTLYMFLMWGTAGVATFASASLVPVLPNGYTSSRLIFPFTTNSAGPVPFTAIEDAGGALICFLTTPVLDVNNLLASASRALFSLSVPTGISLEWQGNAAVVGNPPSSAHASIINSPFEPDISLANVFNGAYAQEPCGNPIPDIFVSSSGAGLGGEVVSRRRITNTSGQLAWRSNYASGLGLFLTTTGWTFSRRL